MRHTAVVMLGFGVVTAILVYFIVEMLYPLKPLEIALGGSTFRVRDIVFVLLCLTLLVRLYFVLRKNRQTS
jgi:hypothetical protein